jgi:nucleoside 2-deoxyribosyltransferase
MPVRVKQIYIASPFFTPKQLAKVDAVEKLIYESGLRYYSPRSDGVLMNLKPEERKAQAGKIFKLNCGNIIHADAVLAILDEHDTGTYWEMGFAYAIRRYNMATNTFRVFSYTTERPTINVMLQQSVDAHAYGLDELKMLLTNYAQGKSIAPPMPTENVV